VSAESRKVRFCVNNPRSLEEREGLLARGFVCKGCLGNCTRCFESRFLELNDRFVEGNTYDEILSTPDTPKTTSGPDEGPPVCDSD